MKTMKKLVAFFAAATMAMSMGISAYADIIEPDISEDNDELIINVSTTAEEQLTMMAYLVPDTTTEDNIPDYDEDLHTMIALDQVAGDPGFTSVPINKDLLEDGKAIAVKIGGSDFELAEFLIVYEKEQEMETVTVYCGDVDGDEDVDADDATYILVSTVGGKKDYSTYPIGSIIANIEGFDLVSGDVDGDGDVDADDATYVLVSTVGGKKDYSKFPIGGKVTFDVPKTQE